VAEPSSVELKPKTRCATAPATQVKASFMFGRMISMLGRTPNLGIFQVLCFVALRCSFALYSSRTQRRVMNRVSVAHESAPPRSYRMRPGWGTANGNQCPWTAATRSGARMAALGVPNPVTASQPGEAK
jgi:hypothetical protein